MDQYTETIELALRLKNEKKYDQAIGILQPLCEKNPDDKVVVGVMAVLLRESSLITGEFSNSIPTLIRSTILSPRSETSSLILFHSLWDIGDFESAIKEAERFTRESDPHIYDEILNEWNSSA